MHKVSGTGGIADQLWVPKKEGKKRGKKRTKVKNKKEKRRKDWWIRRILTLCISSVQE